MEDGDLAEVEEEEEVEEAEVEVEEAEVEAEEAEVEEVGVELPAGDHQFPFQFQATILI